ncbi:restriction endonuclease subunit S [Acinetobacter sp.]|uniref:restriction endonuclease subunit S n=1 Tax=Acinetobacter sp. TaxID=472 RepID=UPI00388F6AA4
MASPKLRFKEFDGNWNTTLLGNICSFTQGVQIPQSEQINHHKSGYIRYLYIRDFFTDKFPCYVLDIYPEKIIQPHEIMMVNTGNTTGEAYTGKCGVLSNNSFKIGYDLKLFDHKFMFLFCSSELAQNQIKKFFNAGGQPHLGHKNVAQLQFSYPLKEEQTKIASFLSAVDEKIIQLTQKHQLLSQYKQGMMQKLFSQQIRFKADDGSEFGEWENLKFRDVITIKYGKDHKALKEGNIPVLGTGGIMRYVDSYLYDGESILIGRKGTIDKPQFISGKFWTVDTLFYTEIGEKLIPKFAYQQLLLVNWLNLNEATGVPSLNTTSIGNIEVKVPCLEEQTKIANFLSAMDQKIEVVAQQIEQAKQWKKGLLQQMFV